MEYKLVYSKARNTISLTVTPNGEIIVRAPIGTNSTLIDKFISKKSNWIEKKLRYYKKFEGKLQKSYVAGGTFLLFGIEHVLVLKLSDISNVTISNRSIVIQNKNIDDPIYVKNILNDFYIDLATSYLITRTKELFTIFNHYKLEIPPVSVLKMKGKWGLCTARNNIKLNRDLIKVPKDCIDYVIFHELSHLIEKNHGTGFYKLLSLYVVNWKDLRNKLKDYGIATLD